MWIVERGRDPEFVDLVDPATTALVLIDVQNDFCHPDGAFGRAGHDIAGMPDIATPLRRLVAEARAREVLTVFVRATYDREVTSRALAQNRRRRGLVQSLCLEGSWGADWFGGVAPAGAPGEIVLTKHRFDAFQGTPLDLYLRNNGIRTVVMVGVATSGCVESTVRDAFFQDYRVVVARDAVAEAGMIFHDSSLGTMKRAFATLADVDDIITAWHERSPQRQWHDVSRRERAEHDLRAEGLVLVDADHLEAGAAEACARLVEAARASTVPVIDVRSVDAPLGRSIFEDASQAAGARAHAEGSAPSELRVDKLRRSAFAATRLALLLRTNEVRHVTFVGTDRIPGSLSATVLDALDADYAVTLATDTCERTLAATLGQAGARLATSAEIAARWRTRPARAGESGADAASAASGATAVQAGATAR